MGRTPSMRDPHAAPARDDDDRDRRHSPASEYARRRSRLHRDPDIDVVDMATLVSIARAIEDEAVRRYALLAELMEARGEPATAAAFRVMLDEERSHVAAVDRWAASVGEPGVAATEVEWRLPEDLSRSWDEISGSALLTPYRAFAVAVENEERAFAFYAYLAARAENARIRAEAEKLGAEELRHAALLRGWRRRAYHRERRAQQTARTQVDSVAMLREVLARHEAAIAAAHLALASRLRRAGDEAGARLLEGALGTTASAADARPDVEAATVGGAPGAQAPEDPRHLLVDAQKPLEALVDALEGVMATADGELFEEAAAAVGRTLERIARISFRIGGSGGA